MGKTIAKIQLRKTNFGDFKIGAELSVPNDISAIQAKELVDKDWAELTSGKLKKVTEIEADPADNYPKDHKKLKVLAAEKGFDKSLHGNHENSKTLVTYLDNLENAPEKNPEYQKELAELKAAAEAQGVDSADDFNIEQLKAVIQTAEQLNETHENIIKKLEAEIETLKAQISKGD